MPSCLSFLLLERQGEQRTGEHETFICIIRKALGFLYSQGRHHIACDGPPPTLTNREGSTPAETSMWARPVLASPKAVSALPHPKKMRGLDVRSCTHLAAYQTTGCQVGVPCPITWGIYEMHFIRLGPDRDAEGFNAPAAALNLRIPIPPDVVSQNHPPR